MAQTIDYASWVQNLSYSDIITLFKEKNNGKELEKEFYLKFETNLPEKINQAHNLIIVAAEVDNETERIINYLSTNYDIPINVVFFKYFQNGQSEYIVRTWLIDLNSVEEKSGNAKEKSKGEEWNGRDFVVTLGEGETRVWDDCVKYGFVSAGGDDGSTCSYRKLFLSG